ncbi:MAG: DUF4124 domain-containing protein [Xanthomonadaceae bacterium]|jgi:hypothetical protein|nr:DUF4124 domain-containing protein [Xanthomonadaceae bacterium]
MRLSSALCLLALIAPAAAQSPINHCIDASGHLLFTDQPCRALQATPLDPVAKPDSDRLARLPSKLCAADLGQLRRNVIAAFAHRDANRLAGLMLWDGDGRTAALADIHALGEWVQQPLLGLDAPGGIAPSGSTALPPTPAGGGAGPPVATAASTPPPASDQLVVHTAGIDSRNELRFQVVERSGCLWLRHTE